MPALTNVAHFLNLVVDAPEAFGWPTFQALTGIEVLPFSENTTAADISFPKDDFAAAVAFCRVYKTYETSEARAKYLAAKDDEHNDGRKAIKLWVMTSWKEWQISERVAGGLEAAGFQGFKYHKEEKEATWQDSKNAQIYEGFPLVANALFGRDGMMSSRKRVRPSILSFVQGLAVASWKAQGKAWVRTRNRLSLVHAKLDADYHALEHAENLTTNQISRIIKRMKGVLNKAEKFADEEIATVVAMWEERIAQLREATVKGAAVNTKIPKALQNALAQLADTPTMRFVVAELDQALVDMEAQMPPEQLPEQLVSLDNWMSGVEHLQDKTPDELWEMLGLLEAKALPGFNTVEDPDGVVDPWTDEWNAFARSEKAVPFGPRWHQLVGIVKMMHHAISGDSLLLMDEVGVGKTLQVIGMIAMYTVFRRYYARNNCFPGAFAQLRCDTADGNLPDCPHVVIVPPPLFRQWSDEFRRYIQRGFFDVIPYQGQWDETVRTTVWETMSTLREGQIYCQKVLLVAGPAAEGDLQYRYQLPLPVPPSRPQVDNSANSNLTLFGYDLGLIVIDEAAKLRNLNRQWTVVHELVSTAQCGIAMTATPIHNGPADLFHLGMALNIPGCDDVEWLLDMKRAIAKATRKSNAEFRQLRMAEDFTQRLLSGELELDFKHEQIDEMERYVSYLRDIFSGSTIRRTIDSVDWEGNPISGLRKYYEKRILLTARPEETRELANTATDIMNEHQTSRAAAIVAQAEGHVSVHF